MGLTDAQKAKLRGKYGNRGMGSLSRTEFSQRVRDGRYKAAVSRATRLGKERGVAAGSWVIDGNTSTEAARRILQGYEDGDPEIMDIQPSPLSGEWADEPLPRDILQELGVTESSDISGDLLDAFEVGYSEGFWDEVTRSARYQVGES